MLFDEDRKKLESLISERLTASHADAGGSPAYYVARGKLENPEGQSVEGLLGVASSQVVFASMDLIKGEVWHQWGRSQVMEMRLDDDIMGLVLSFRADGRKILVRQVPKEDGESLKQALVLFGFTKSQVETISSSEHPEENEDDSASFEIAADCSDQDQAVVSLEFTEPESVPTRQKADMWSCAQCGVENKIQYKFCLSCGAERTEEGFGSHADRPQAAETPRLVGILGLRRGEVIPLTEALTKVGRMASLPVSIPSRDMSRIHAVIERTDEGYVVIDMSSANGTCVNGKGITKHLLRDGEVIRFGNDHEFSFVAGTDSIESIDSFETRPSEGKSSNMVVVCVIVAAVVTLLAGLLVFLAS